MIDRRNFLTLAVSGIGACALTACTDGANGDATSGVEAADLVITNAVIQTMDADHTVAEAVAVRGGEIVFVGDADGAEAYKGDSTTVMDLDGAFVAPGLIDAHTHEVQGLMVQMFQCYLTETEPTVTAYQAALKDYAEKNPDLEVINGGSIDLSAFENNSPTAAWIDEVVSDRPVVLSDASLHGRCLNTKAMEACGITKDTPDPDGGIIYRDADGNPTGYFSDCLSLLTNLGDTTELGGEVYTATQYEEALKVYQEHANSLGFTSYQLGGNEIDPEEQWGVYQKLEAAGELTLRVGATIWGEGYADGGYSAEAAQRDVALLDANQKRNSDFIKINMLKMKFDGVPEGASSYLLEPYDKGAGYAEDYVGTLNGNEADLTDYVAVANAAGYQVQIHAMGDASVGVALNAFESSIDTNGEGDYRNVITHVNLITDEDKKRMGDLGVIAAMQPLWFYYDPQFSALEVHTLGKDRVASEYHIRDMVDAGVIITGSADYPITEDNPLDGIEAGVTQCSPFPEEEDTDEFLRNADQTVDAFEALSWYTTNAAYQMKMDDRIGSIEVGKKGDFVVLSHDITTCDPKKINEATVLYTISDGRVVFEG